MPTRCINLTFHGVGEPARPVEASERAVWVDAETFGELLDSVAGRDDVRITFDDGNASDVEVALDALLDRGLRATFFVVAGRIGGDGFLDESGVQVLAAAGMDIGCHGMRHQPWRRLGRPALEEELVDSRRRLEDVVGRPVRAASCPFGAYDRRVLRALRSAGYEHVFTSDDGFAGRDDWLQARNTVTSGAEPTFVEQILAREREPVGALGRRARRVVKRWR